jgi:HSP20 family molecular chaperone IbpA
MDDDDTTYTPAKRDMVAGLDKGLQVIEAFDQERSRLTIAEVAERTGLTRAAARRYLITLTHLGYMRHDSKLFSLTPAVLRLGQSYLHSARLPRIAQPSYPPYNIELVTEDKYRVTMAVAGFDRSELEIETERDLLKIVGRRQKDDAKRTYLHRGIAARQFQRTFVLAEGMEVLGADLKNGLLSIDLARPEPERIAKSIAINEHE